MNHAAPGSFLFDDAGGPRERHRARGQPGATATAPQGFDGAWHLEPDGAVAPETACLLANLLRHVPARDAAPLTVHMLACGALRSIGDVAYGLARASAAGLGRTLLTRTGGPPGRAAGVRPAGLTRINRVIPDADVERLFHFDTGDYGAGGLAVARGCEPALLAVEPFRMVILPENSCAAGAALAEAPFCTGTILVVQAGVTQQAQVRQAIRAVARAGGHVLGTILATPP